MGCLYILGYELLTHKILPLEVFLLHLEKKKKRTKKQKKGEKEEKMKIIKKTKAKRRKKKMNKRLILISFNLWEYFNWG